MEKFLSFCYEFTIAIISAIPMLLIKIAPIIAIIYFIRAYEFENSLKSVCSSHYFIMEVIDHSPYIPYLDTTNLSFNENVSRTEKIRTAVYKSNKKINLECEYILAE